MPPRSDRSSETKRQACDQRLPHARPARQGTRPAALRRALARTSLAAPEHACQRRVRRGGPQPGRIGRTVRRDVGHARFGKRGDQPCVPDQRIRLVFRAATACQQPAIGVHDLLGHQPFEQLPDPGPAGGGARRHRRPPAPGRLRPRRRCRLLGHSSCLWHNGLHPCHPAAHAYVAAAPWKDPRHPTHRTSRVRQRGAAQVPVHSRSRWHPPPGPRLSRPNSPNFDGSHAHRRSTALVTQMTAR